VSTILQTIQLTKRFGGLLALDHLDLQVQQYQIVGLIGPNGAGKTTLFNCLTGTCSYHGEVSFKGRPLHGLPDHAITRLGIARTFQNIRLFSSMTVLENILVGRHCRMQAGVWGALARNPQARKEELENLVKSNEILKFLGMEDLRNTPAGQLSYGDQRRLEIGRALATEPRLLLMDEPTAGMNPAETAHLAALIKAACSQWQLTIILIEHDMRMVMGISDHVIVLDYGFKLAEGPPAAVQQDPAVIAAYLGKRSARSKIRTPVQERI